MNRSSRPCRFDAVLGCGRKAFSVKAFLATSSSRCCPENDPPIFKIVLRRSVVDQVPVPLSAQFGMMLLCSVYRATRMPIVAPLGQCCRRLSDDVCRTLSLGSQFRTSTHSNCTRRTRLRSFPSCAFTLAGNSFGLDSPGVPPVIVLHVSGCPKMHDDRPRSHLALLVAGLLSVRNHAGFSWCALEMQKFAIPRMLVPCSGQLTGSSCGWLLIHALFMHSE